MKINLLFYALIFVSCNQEGEEVNLINAKPQNEEVISEGEADNNFDFSDLETPENIVGEWTHCEFSSGELGRFYNVCWDFNFNSNGTGTFIKPSKDVGNFHWGAKNDSLTFKFPTLKDEELFFSKETQFYYSVVNSITKKRTNLALCLGDDCYKMSKSLEK